MFLGSARYLAEAIGGRLEELMMVGAAVLRAGRAVIERMDLLGLPVDIEDLVEVGIIVLLYQ